MNQKNVREAVYGNYAEGFHCAESVAGSILKAHGTDRDLEAVRAASAFRGGIGACKKDVCGALTGGLVAIGQLFGRNGGGEDIDELMQMARGFREEFIQQFGSTNCAELMEHVSKSPILGSCQDLSAAAAALLDTLIVKYKK